MPGWLSEGTSRFIQEQCNSGASIVDERTEIQKYINKNISLRYPLQYIKVTLTLWERVRNFIFALFTCWQSQRNQQKRFMEALEKGDIAEASRALHYGAVLPFLHKEKIQQLASDNFPSLSFFIAQLDRVKDKRQVQEFCRVCEEENEPSRLRALLCKKGYIHKWTQKLGIWQEGALNLSQALRRRSS